MSDLSKKGISNFAPNFPPLHAAVFQGNDDVVAALIATPPANGLELEVHGFFDFFDTESLHTTFGTAVVYFSSVTTIEALLKAGANPRAHLISNHWSMTPLQKVRQMRETALEKIEEFGEFWLEFCGRAPTAEWFDQVEALLLAAEATGR
jgi:hypothetical protein